MVQNVGCGSCWQHLLYQVNTNQQGSLWCNNCNFSFEWTKPGYLFYSRKGKEESHYLTRFYNSDDVIGSAVVWQKDENKNPEIITPKAVKAPISKDPNSGSVNSYEDCYWKFVKSTTDEDATSWFDEMISKVTMDLQPAGDDWKSWVREPKVSKIKPREDGLPKYWRLTWVIPAIVAFTTIALTIIFSVIS